MHGAQGHSSDEFFIVPVCDTGPLKTLLSFLEVIYLKDPGLSLIMSDELTVFIYFERLGFDAAPVTNIESRFSTLQLTENLERCSF